MTNEVQTEETPNPYNQNKSWQNENKVDFVSANEGLYFEEPTKKNKLFNSNDITDIEAEGNVNTEELDTDKDKKQLINKKGMTTLKNIMILNLMSLKSENKS